MAKTTTGDQWILDSYGGYCRWCGRRRTFPFEKLTEAKALPCENSNCPSNVPTLHFEGTLREVKNWEAEIIDD